MGPGADLVDQGLQTELGIADEGVLNGHVLLEVGRIAGGVDDRGLRHALAEPGSGEAGPDGEDHVGSVEEVPDLLADRAARGAEGQRMVFGEGRLAGQCRRHRDLKQLGQVLQLVPGLGVVHALPGVDHGVVGPGQDLGRFGHGLRVGPDAGAPCRDVAVGRVLGLVAHDVGRHFDDTGRGGPFRSAEKPRSIVSSTILASPMWSVSLATPLICRHELKLGRRS